MKYKAEIAGEPLRSKKPANPNNWHLKRKKEDGEGLGKVDAKAGWDELPEPSKNLHPAAKRLERKQAKGWLLIMAH